MSHLKTIIARVENRLIICGGDIDCVKKDPLWLQSIRNLKEYQEHWTDYTTEEREEADYLYNEYSKYLN